MQSSCPWNNDWNLEFWYKWWDELAWKNHFAKQNETHNSWTGDHFLFISLKDWKIIEFQTKKLRNFYAVIKDWHSKCRDYKIQFWISHKVRLTSFVQISRVLSFIIKTAPKIECYKNKSANKSISCARSSYCVIDIRCLKFRVASHFMCTNIHLTRMF